MITRLGKWMGFKKPYMLEEKNSRLLGEIFDKEGL